MEVDPSGFQRFEFFPPDEEQAHSMGDGGDAPADGISHIEILHVMEFGKHEESEDVDDSDKADTDEGD